MRVVDMLVGLELTCLNIQAHLLISIAERHASSSQTIHLLNGEHRVVHRVIEDMLVNLYLINDVGSHLQTVFQLSEGWQEHFLDNLEVTEITDGQIVHDQGHLLGQ